MARRIDDALRGHGTGLQVAAPTEGHGAGNTLVGAGVVAEERVLGAGDVHAVAGRRDGLLVLAGGGRRGLEHEGGVLGGAGLSGELGGVPGTLGAVSLGEVAAGVEGAVGFGDAHSLD